MSLVRAVFLLVIVVGIASTAWGHGATTAKPVFVGARVCGECHEGSGMGNQYSLWLHSKHSRAWASLSTPQAPQITRISGIIELPQDAMICLGCHAPAALTEAWQRDSTFRLSDGVQCEDCHGPGSEYRYVMTDRQAAMMAGLRMPGEDDCMRCHIEKGSHAAVLSTPAMNVKDGMQAIAHPSPKVAQKGKIPRLDSEEDADVEGPKFAGSSACGNCHSGPSMGYQMSWWLRDSHSRSYAVLGTPRGRQVARAEGVKGDPAADSKCLTCHVTGYGEEGSRYLASFSADEGVGCEACHGAGSEYMFEAIMRDPPAARAAGLRAAADTCLSCHEKAHGKPFDVEEALGKILHPLKPAEVEKEPVYKTPLNLALRPDGSEIYVACEASNSVVVVDPVSWKAVHEIQVGVNPADVAFSADGRWAFVSNRHDNTVSVIDPVTRKVERILQTGAEPHGLATDFDSRHLYVLNTASEDISVFETGTFEFVKVLSASRGPWALSLSPDGKAFLVTNHLSRITRLRKPFVSEVTALETTRGTVSDRIVVDGANLMLSVDWHPSGEFALATMNRTKSLVPMTRLLQGWTITNGLAVIWADGDVDQVLLDEPTMGFADATAVAITPDGRYALVTSATTDRVAVVDIRKLVSLIRRSSDYDRRHVLPNHLGMSAEFLVKYIPTGNSPRGLLIMPDGRTAFVANALNDSLTVLDLRTLDVAGRVDLGGPKEITKARYGERLFHSADITFRRQFSCHSCHPNGHIDGVTYDIEPDGIGISPVDNRTLRGILDTAPFKWEGTNPSLSRQCGARLSVFFTRIQPFTPEELSAVDYYITTIPRPPNRFYTPGSEYSPAQRRGREMFERTMMSDGSLIPAGNRCITCHPPPYYTDRRVHDVGTKQLSDRTGRFDTPHLNNIYDSAPYLHNGMSATLEEIWTVYNPYDRHGQTNDMTKDQLNDLMEYLKTL